MKLGADRKKIWILGGLLVLGGYLFYSNVVSTTSAPEPSRPGRSLARTGAATPPDASNPETQTSQRRPLDASRANGEFRPSLKPKRAEDRVDPMTTDPTLRTDLLEKVQAVEMQGGSRNLFQVSAAPPVALPAGSGPIVPVKPSPFAAESKPGPPLPPPAPTAPPITLKYYGYSSARGDNRKRAFFLDGDEILVAGEGETVVTAVKRRYRVVRIGVNSVEMEDTEFKEKRTLPLQAEAAG